MDQLTEEQLDELIDLEAEINRNEKILTVCEETLSRTEAATASTQLTKAQKAQIERNRQKAMILKQARQKAHPYSKSNAKICNTTHGISEERFIRYQGNKYIEGGGFLLDVKDLEEQQKDQPKLVDVPAPIIESDRPRCLECQEEFPDSFLLQKFDHPVCDKCRDHEDKHAFITKTDAKNEYLLRDFDFDKREPPLKFIVRKNPHNSRWGDMKLYLQFQVEKRAMEIWESEEKLEEEREQREENREKGKIKKYNKQVKALRMGMRSSLYKKTTENHTHEFEPETYDEEEDMYSKKCLTCDYVQTYEKM